MLCFLYVFQRKRCPTVTLEKGLFSPLPQSCCGVRFPSLYGSNFCACCGFFPFSNENGAPQQLWRKGFFPLFPKVAVGLGFLRFSIAISAHVVFSSCFPTKTLPHSNFGEKAFFPSSPKLLWGWVSFAFRLLFLRMLCVLQVFQRKPCPTATLEKGLSFFFRGMLPTRHGHLQE